MWEQAAGREEKAGLGGKEGGRQQREPNSAAGSPKESSAEQPSTEVHSSLSKLLAGLRLALTTPVSTVRGWVSLVHVLLPSSVRMWRK